MCRAPVSTQKAVWSVGATVALPRCPQEVPVAGAQRGTGPGQAAARRSSRDGLGLEHGQGPARLTSGPVHVQTLLCCLSRAS